MSIRKIILILIAGVGLVILSAGFKSGNDRFAKLSTLAKLVNIVYSNYVEDVDMDKTLEGAITGMLEELDPHSTYIPKKEFEDVKEQFAGEFEGIGIEFDILDGYITVISPIPGISGNFNPFLHRFPSIPGREKAARASTNEVMLIEISKNPKGQFTRTNHLSRRTL